MTPIPPALGESVRELIDQLRQVQARLDVVERKLGVSPVSQVADPPRPAAVMAEQPGLWPDTAASTGLVGKSLLGLALAYALRALTENGSLPVGWGVAIGVAYALAWLIWAARTSAEETLTVSLRALTSALIAVPLLWEARDRFQALSDWTTAGVLVFFTVFGLGISWRKDLTAVAWISSLAGLLSCCALLFRTHALLPYTSALLALALAVEVSACLGHYLQERWAVAAVADLAVLLMTFVATRPPGSIAGYPAMNRTEVIGIQIVLVLIYLASTFYRTLGRGFKISGFEIAQCVAAVAISSYGALKVAQGQPAAVLLVALFCAMCGVACYTVSFAFLQHHPESNRNFHMYATFGFALALAGTSLLFHGTVLISIWSGLAVFFVLLGRHSGRMTLKLHAGGYLALATVVSGAAGAGVNRYLTPAAHPGSMGSAVGVSIVALAGVAVYWMMMRSSPPEGAVAPYRAASILVAASGMWSVSALGALLALPICRLMESGSSPRDFCPTVLTIVLVTLAVAAVAAARHFDRPELKWIGVLLLIAETYKLVVQDLGQGHTVAVMISLLVYGGALIMLPRFFRRAPAAAH